MLGNLTADAQLAAISALEKGGAQIAFMNSGGMRADLPVMPVADDVPYRVTMNRYLAAGGDRFSVFLEGVQPTGGPVGVGALTAYLQSGVARQMPVLERITRVD
jgi:2',3'-cyclic-nucleotide 2'-phosphodiesterase (5'-nucleotidase family)